MVITVHVYIIRFCEQTHKIVFCCQIMYININACHADFSPEVELGMEVTCTLKATALTSPWADFSRHSGKY